MAALSGSERGTLERFRAALGEAHELMRRAERAARRRAWHEAAEQLNASQEAIDRAKYELIKQMRTAGLSWPAIAREFKERGWMAVYRRYQRLERRFGQEPFTSEAGGDNGETPD